MYNYAASNADEVLLGKVPRSRNQQAPYPSDASSHCRDIMIGWSRQISMPVLSWHSEGSLIIVMLCDCPWQVYGGPHVDGDLMKRSRCVISNNPSITALHSERSHMLTTDAFAL